jgi:demethylmenaquinone methyltransferase/2-methoxy-6-polyprenyl-1,4-benzoquinol methylase
MPAFDLDKAARVRSMFARIVPRYDLMNRVMTLGLDQRWREATVALAEPAGDLALDAATGTGDLALALVRHGWQRVVALDFCPEMLAVARRKIATQGASGKVALMAADALSLPFPANVLDCVVNAFLLRNVTNLTAALSEFHRVLRPGGRLVCLDLTHPPAPLKLPVAFYRDIVVPFLGGAIGGDFHAYRYLGDSLKPYPDAQRLAAMLRRAGFAQVDYRLCGFGAVAIHRGWKKESVAPC